MVYKINGLDDFARHWNIYYQKLGRERCYQQEGLGVDDLKIRAVAQGIGGIWGGLSGLQTM